MAEWNSLNRISCCNTISITITQLRKQVQALQVSCHLHPPLWLWNMNPACWLCEKDPGFQNQVPGVTSSSTYNSSPTWSTRRTTGFNARSTPLRVHRNLFWHLSRHRNLHGSGMSHTTTASPKPSFRAPWKVGDAMVGRRNAGWTISKSRHPCPCQNCSQRLPREMTSKGSLLNHPSCPPDVPIGQGTQVNWNSLPDQVVTAPSVQLLQFKTYLDTQWRNLPSIFKLISPYAIQYMQQ